MLARSIAHLRETANSARRDNRRWVKAKDDSRRIYADSVGCVVAIMAADEENDEAFSTFITTFDPITVLSLLDEVEKLREEKEGVNKILRRAIDDPVFLSSLRVFGVE